MRLIIYLSFSGNCREAFTFYQQVLGGEITDMVTHEGVFPEDVVPAEWVDKIMHAALIVGDQHLMGADTPPEYYAAPQGFSVSVHADTVEEAERIYAALSEGGSIEMELQETPWAIRFAMFRDRFGIPWLINYQRPA